jgi:PAS domain S-box-containing protein
MAVEKSKIKQVNGEQLYKTALDYVSDVFFILDKEGIVVYENKAAKKILGFKSNEIIGKNAFEQNIFSKTQYPKLIANFRKNLLGETTGPEEFLFIKKDGSLVKVEIISRPIIINDKTYILNIANDIRERASFKKIIQESEEAYKAIFNNTGTATTIFDEKNILLIVNEEFEKLSGYKKEEIEGKLNWTVLVDKDDLEKMKSYHEKRIAGNENPPASYEFKLINKSHEIKNIFLKAGLIPGTKKTVASLIDITNYKNVEEKLHEREETFRALAETTSDTIMRFDKDCRHLYVNPAVENETGIPAEKFIGKTHAELGFPADLVKIFDDSICEVFATRRPKRVEFMLPNKNYMDWKLIPEFDTKGQIKAVMTFARNITEIKKTEKSLKSKILFEKLITEISTKFISLSLVDFEIEINRSLELIGKFLNVDRSYIFLFKENFKFMQLTYAWWKPGIEANAEKFKNFEVKMMPWFKDKILKLKEISFSNLDDIPAEAQAERNIFKGQQIKSILCIPLIYNKIIIGFIGLDSVKEKKEWTENNIALLKVSGELFANTIMRSHIEQEAKRKSEELERFNKLAVGRELKMIELKKKIQELEK